MTPDQDRPRARIEERPAESRCRLGTDAGGGAGVARREHDQDFFHTQQTVAGHMREIGNSQRQRGLRETIDIARHETMRGEDNDAISGQIGGLYGLFVPDGKPFSVSV